MLSIVESLRERAVRHPERLALMQGDTRMTYGELWSRVLAVASRFSELGVRSGERVLLAAPSDPGFVQAYFAAHWLGAVAVPVDPGASANRRDDVARRTRPILAVGTDARDWATADCPVITGDSLKMLPSGNGPDVNAPALDSLADIIFTTGTTGRSKGVRLAHRNLAAAAGHINTVMGTTEDDVEVVPIPLYQTFGLGRLRCVLAAGGSIALVQGFRLPGEIFSALKSYRATGLVGVPAGFAILLRFGIRGLGPFASQLRYVEIGSAPMPLEHKQKLMELLPRTALFMHYGLTEASRSAFIEFHRHHDRLHTAGKPAPGVSMAIRDEAGADCPPGVPGGLWICGAHVSPGYWDDPELSARNFVDGWVRTGDMAHLDGEGFVRLQGRLDDIINVGGYKVSPDEVERVLETHPGVAEAACIGIPDPRGIAGQVVRAYLVTKAGQPQALTNELSDWVTERLESYKIPVEYVWVPMLPRTESGKLMRVVLRKEFPAGN